MIHVIYPDSVSYLSIVETEDGTMLRVEKDLDGYADDSHLENRVEYWATSAALVSRFAALTADGIPLHVSSDWANQNLFLGD